MPDLKISELTLATPGDDDVIPFTDVGASVTYKALKSALKGETGATGAAGTDGDDAYVYIAYASDASGTDFTTTFDANLDYIAILNTTTAIAVPQASDFAGLWKNYKGATGATGAAGVDGTDGADGDDAYVYIAYASADDGTDFTTTFNAALDYIAIKTTTTAIPAPAVGDFAGLWKNYKGATGATGATGPTGATGAPGEVQTLDVSVTDNAIARFHETDGTNIQNSLVTIDDSGSVNIPSGQSYKIDNTALAVGDITGAAPSASPTFTGTVTLPKTVEIQDTSADHQYVLAVNELTADRTVTLPLLTGNDEFVFKDHTQTLTNKTLSGTVTLADNCRFDLTLPSADTYVTGPTTDSFASGYSASAFDLVFMGSNSKWLEVDADAVATCKGLIGIALEAKNDTEAMKVALPGSFVRWDTWNWTVGATLYAGETLGAIQESIPTGADAVIKVIGFAVNADTIYFNPSPDQQTTIS